MKIKPNWQHFQHVADIGIKGCGNTIEQAFTQAAIAMTAVITEPRWVNNTTCFDVECESADLEYLFFDWLNILIYEMASRHMLFNKFTIQIHDGHLTASICGEPADNKKHQPAVEIKGATLTELQVTKDQQGTWCAQCVLDV